MANQPSVAITQPDPTTWRIAPVETVPAYLKGIIGKWFVRRPGEDRGRWRSL